MQAGCSAAWQCEINAQVDTIRLKEEARKPGKGMKFRGFRASLLPPSEFFPRMALMAADNPHPIRVISGK
jgi:hypothetical protein